MKAWLEYQRGEREAAVRTAQQLRELATTHGFAYWLDAAIVLSHTTAKALTLPTLAALRGELGAMQSAVWRKVFLLCVFAQLCAEAGHAEEGFRALALIGEADRLAYLARFGSVTVLNGHIHQILQKVEGNVTFHTARSTAFPQPEPGKAESPGPMKNVPAEKLRSMLGLTQVSYVEHKRPLAIVDSTLE